MAIRKKREMVHSKGKEKGHSLICLPKQSRVDERAVANPHRYREEGREWSADYQTMVEREGVTWDRINDRNVSHQSPSLKNLG